MLQEDDPTKVAKLARAHFLSVNDEGALNKMAAGLKGQGLSQVIQSGTVTGLY